VRSAEGVFLVRCMARKPAVYLECGDGRSDKPSSSGSKSCRNNSMLPSKRSRSMAQIADLLNLSQSESPLHPCTRIMETVPKLLSSVIFFTMSSLSAAAVCHHRCRGRF
jgi:hypothetical protein